MFYASVCLFFGLVTVETQVFLLNARGKITKKGIVKFKVKLEYSVKGQKHFKEVC